MPDIEYRERGLLIKLPGLLIILFGCTSFYMALFAEVIADSTLAKLVFRFFIACLGLAMIRLGAGQTLVMGGFVVSPANRQITQWERNALLKKVFRRWPFDDIEKWEVITDAVPAFAGRVRVWKLRISVRSEETAVEVSFYTEREAQAASETLAQYIRPDHNIEKAGV